MKRILTRDEILARAHEPCDPEEFDGREAAEFGSQISQMMTRWTEQLHRVAIPDPVGLAGIVPFHETLAETLADFKPERKRETRGRKAQWDWEGAGLAVIGRIYRGEVTEPKTQAAVEAMLSDWFSVHCGGETPGETECRKHAKLIWREISEVGN